MSSNLHPYERKSQNLKTKKDVEKKTTPETEHAIEIPTNIPQGYSKPDGERDYSLIILILEDAKTTREYFKKITDTQSNIHIVLVVDKKRGIPADYMEEEAEKAEEKYATNSQVDKLYLICDLDHYRIKLCELDIICNTKGWNLIISNPCIEIWFYYHACCSCPMIPDKEEGKRSQQLKNHWNTKKNNNNYKEYRYIKHLITHHQKAIINSKANYKLEKGSKFMPDIYSTQMHILIEELLPHIPFCLQQPSNSLHP